MSNTIVATNWSSSGNAKRREVKASAGRIGDLYQITVTDRETQDFMKIATDRDGAIALARSILSV